MREGLHRLVDDIDFVNQNLHKNSTHLSDIPFVAGGYAINNIRDVSVKKILNGEVDFLYGQYLAVFIVSIVFLFLLGIVRIFFKRKTQSSN